jgi:hypothetical protein
MGNRWGIRPPAWWAPRWWGELVRVVTEPARTGFFEFVAADRLTLAQPLAIVGTLPGQVGEPVEFRAVFEASAGRADPFAEFEFSSQGGTLC